MLNNFLTLDEKPKAAIFMSGSGSNAEKLLESGDHDSLAWEPSVLVTDRPQRSRTFEIAQRFNLPVIAHDIKEFYLKHGQERISIMTDQGREIRELWTNELREQIRPFGIHFGILAGFVPLTNITSDFPCLNVHPGDLTVEKDGKRLLVGLHTIPVELAIYEELTCMRSSVIVAQTYTGNGGEMDSGPILGVSTPVTIDLMGHSLESLRKMYEQRPAKRPIGGYKDELENIADFNQNKLKENGDWVVFPKVVNNFAKNCYAVDDQDNLYFKEVDGWIKIKTIEYGTDSQTIIEA